jgi:hypothetical protein
MYENIVCTSTKTNMATAQNIEMIGIDTFKVDRTCRPTKVISSSPSKIK